MLAGIQLGGAQLALAASAQRSEIGITGEVLATLSLSHGRHTTSSHSVGASSASRVHVTSAITRAAPEASGLGYQASATAGEGTRELAAAATARGAYGRVDLTAQWDERGGVRSSLAVAGALVLVGGSVHASRPIDGGFALVRVPGASGARVYVDNQVVGTTNRDGELLVPSLLPYYGNRVGLDVRDVPLTASATTLERLVAPVRFGGAVVAFSSRPATLVRGTLVGRRGGARVDLSYGELTVEGLAPVPVGSDGRFEIDALGAGAHRAHVEVDGERCATVIEASGDAAIVEIGAIACRFPEVN